MALRAMVVAVTSAALLMPVPLADAAPAAPDVDSLIDDSGPRPGNLRDLASIPNQAFTTESGLLCKMWHGRITYDVHCAGNFPGAPAETHTVQLPGIYGKESAAARFLPSPPDALVGSTAGMPVAALPVGHKLVFWESPAQSLVCGVPPSTDLVCVLKEPLHTGGAIDGPVTTHGFVIAAPQSWVF